MVVARCQRRGEQARPLQRGSSAIFEDLVEESFESMKSGGGKRHWGEGGIVVSFAAKRREKRRQDALRGSGQAGATKAGQHIKSCGHGAQRAAPLHVRERILKLDAIDRGRWGE